MRKEQAEQERIRRENEYEGEKELVLDAAGHELFIARLRVRPHLLPYADSLILS